MNACCSDNRISSLIFYSLYVSCVLHAVVVNVTLARGMLNIMYLMMSWRCIFNIRVPQVNQSLNIELRVI